MASPRTRIGRTIMVIEDQPYLWAALQQRVRRETAYVRSAAPHEAAAAWASCAPWPWLVVGATTRTHAGLPALLAHQPVPLHWLGDPPSDLAGAATRHEDWQGLVAEMERLNELCLNGVRLLRNRGLLAPDGRVVLDVPQLESLLASPGGLAVDGEPARSALAANGLPLEVERDGALVRLVAAP
jgi:hypothetical protein